MTEHDVALNGLRFRCAVGPGTGPPLVLLHGGSSRWQSWEPALPTLTERWTVYALDLRGHGGSEHAGSYALGSMGEDVALFVRDVVGQPAVLFGHSLGALVALATAEMAPDLVRAVVWGDAPLEAEAVRHTVLSQQEMNERWRSMSGGAVSMEALEADLRSLQVMPGSTETLEEALGEDSPWFPFMAQSLYLQDPAFLGALLEDFDGVFAGWDPARMLGGLACPLLLVQGDPLYGGLLKDDMVAAARRWKPDLQVVTVEGVGHALHTMAAEPVLTAAGPFLDEVRDP